MSNGSGRAGLPLAAGGAYPGAHQSAAGTSPVTAVGSRARDLLVGSLLAISSFLLSIAVGEVTLRTIYAGGSRYTAGAPGSEPFEHLMFDAPRRLRSRLQTGPKTPGVPRVMVLGDSITWGYGVRNWEDTWPEQLARRFDGEGRPHEFAVFAYPAREIDAHLDQWNEWAGRVQPDALVYQWFVNDIELSKHRPAPPEAPWRRWPWHPLLRRSSYLYSILDERLGAALPSPERSYDEYLLEDFVPGSWEWTEFERVFHSLAAKAAEIAPTRILVLYPQVPFSGAYPLQPIHDRMLSLAHARRISIPPSGWTRESGTLMSRPDSPWRSVVRLPAHAGALALVTGPYYVRRSADLTISFATAAARHDRFATVRLLDAEHHTELATAPLDEDGDETDAHSERRIAHVHLAEPDDLGRDVQFAIGDSTDELDIASIDLQVHHDFDVIDLTHPLNRINSHVSGFDAHPNPRAHGVIANAVFDMLSARERTRPGPSQTATH